MTINPKYSQESSLVSSHFLSKGWVHALLIGGLAIFGILLPKLGFVGSIVFGLLPFTLIGLILLLSNTNSSFYVMYAAQFLFVAASMVFEVKLGVYTLILTLFVTALFILRNMYERIDFTESRNWMLYIFLIWGMYCLFEIANPNNVMEAWNISIAPYLVYPVVCAVLVPLAIRNIKGIQWLLFIWSIFILIGSIKGYWQKNHGFSERDMYFLYVLGGAKTHIIWSGIRFFSCFSDATNYGIHMGMAATCFGISIFYVKNFWIKVYFIIIVIAAIYSMGISGTRGSIVVPIGGLALFVLLSKSKIAGIIGILLLISLYTFFRFTNIGDGNDQIRRMRTGFQPTEDASYQVRIINRALIKELMANKPFGYGLGLSKGDRFSSKERMPYPPDSWLVSVWVEVGIIGLILYLFIHAFLFIWCSWTLMFRIKNNQLRGMLTAWLCMNAGFFLVTYTNDVMQYPNPITIYTGFALCFVGPFIEKHMLEKENQ